MVENFVKISENDCKQVLAKYFNKTPPKLINFSLAPISDEVNGFMSDHLLLKINVENDSKNQLRFFAKTLLVSQEIIVEFAKSANMFNKEVICYKFLEDVKKECPGFDTSFAPKYYFSREDEVIVLEDISEKGFKMWSGPLDLDLEHIKLTLTTTARFHAASFIVEEIKSKNLGREYQLIEDYGEGLSESLYTNDENFLGFQYIMSGVKGLCAIIDLLPGKKLSATEFKTKLRDLTSQVFEDIKPSRKFRNVWCNGDLWTKNVMFQYKNNKPVDCKIFDFQLQRYNPPAHDVLFMIYQTADRKTRQKHFDYLLDYYYEALKIELRQAGFDIENILSRDEFNRSIKMVFPSVKLTKAIYKSLSAISRKSFDEIISSSQLYADITFRDRSEFAVKVFRAEKNYRDIMTILLEDLEDIFTHETITIEDCYKILKQNLGTTDYDLLEYKVIPFEEKTGFLGEHAQLKIKIKQVGEVKELSFFVKGMPTSADLKKYAEENHVFLKEMNLYNRIVPEMIANNVNLLKECLADCYLAFLNDVMVFDDYSLKGYKTINSRTPYEYETVSVVIKKLAKFHASGLILEEKLSNPGHKVRLGNYYVRELAEAIYNENKNRAFMKSIIKGTLTLIDLFPDENSKISHELFKKRATNAYYRIFEKVKPSKKYRNTICHADLWTNNILHKFENGSSVDCILVDFQLMRYNLPAQDLMSFLFMCTDRKFRAQYFREMLDLYHLEFAKHFEDHGIDINNVLPYEEFLESCEEMKEFAVAQYVSHFHCNALTSNQIKELYADDESSGKYFFEDRGPFIAYICGKDPVYREKLRECIIDLREVCENSNLLD